MKACYIALLAVVALFASAAVAQTNNCAICKDVAIAGHYIAELEGWNSTQLLAEIDQVCAFLGQYQTECTAIVDSFGAELTTCITAPNFNATQCCADISLCSATSRSVAPNKAAIKEAVMSIAKTSLAKKMGRK